MCTESPHYEQAFLFDYDQPCLSTPPSSMAETTDILRLTAPIQPALFDFEEPICVDPETGLEIIVSSNGNELSLQARTFDPDSVGRVAIRFAA